MQTVCGDKVCGLAILSVATRKETIQLRLSNCETLLKYLLPGHTAYTSFSSFQMATT